MTSGPGAPATTETPRHTSGLPAHGRVVEGRRTVRVAEVGADRRARLDTLARYLHDVAEDDAASAGLPATVGWLLRSTRLEIDRFPTLGEAVVLQTFCSATASRWAERTTLVRGSSGARLRAVSIWVAVDTRTGAPTRLGDWFFAVYGPSAAGRRASARLSLGPPSAPVRRSARPWPVRRSDVDAWAHVNNAVAWEAVEDAIDLDAQDAVVAFLEHHVPIDPGMEPVLAAEHRDDQWSVWLLGPGEEGALLVAAAIEVRHGGLPAARW